MAVCKKFEQKKSLEVVSNPRKFFQALILPSLEDATTWKKWQSLMLTKLMINKFEEKLSIGVLLQLRLIYMALVIIRLHEPQKMDNSCQ